MTDQDMTIRELITQSHETAVSKGWWESGVGNRPILEQLMLMVTELAEATEEIRSGHKVGDVHYDTSKTPPKPEGFLVELADCMIRMGDTIAAYGLTDMFVGVLIEKMNYNKTREHRHGNKTA